LLQQHNPTIGGTICTAAIWSNGIDVLPLGVAVTSVSATQVASWLWLPSRPRVPQSWLLNVTVEFSAVDATGVIVSADAARPKLTGCYPYPWRVPEPPGPLGRVLDIKKGNDA
jgi:hypothetical protein